jgi:molecular chaperone GrpE
MTDIADNKNDNKEAAEPTENSLKEKLEKSEKERAEYLAGWQRAKADFINYKKEEMQHLEDIARYGSLELLKDLIAVMDSFDLGLRSMEKAGSVDKGIYMIRAQIEDVLRKRGVERITVKVGEEFNPSVAEAIVTAESDKPAGTVLEEIEPGYRLYDKILRPARVKIAKTKM